jgi:hypothetical protein
MGWARADPHETSASVASARLVILATPDSGRDAEKRDKKEGKGQSMTFRNSRVLPEEAA